MPVRIVEEAPMTTRHVRVIEEAQPVPVKAAASVSEGQGFIKGANRVVNNMLPVLEVTGRGPLRELADIGSDAIRTQISKREAGGTESGKVGEFLGGTAATLPITAGNPALAGAVAGFANSDADNVAGRTMDTGLGAVGGKLGQLAVKAGSSALRGVTDPAMKLLTDAGVRLPPELMLGPGVKRMVDKATSLPVVGGAIDKARNLAMQDFRTGAINQGLAPLGEKLPKGVTGHDAIVHAEDTISDAYNAVLPKLSARLDPEFATGMQDIGKKVATLPEGHQKQFQAILHDSLAVGEDGVLDGRMLKAAESDIGQQIADYRVSPNPADRRMARSLQDVQTEIREMIARQNPDEAPLLQAANKAFRTQAVIDDAASRADDANFTPAGLKQASRRADKTSRKRGSARGEGPLQAYATAGKAVMSGIADSGTAGRLNLTNIPLIIAGLPLALAYKGGQAASKALTGARPAWAPGIADKLERLVGPRLGLIGSTAPKNPR